MILRYWVLKTMFKLVFGSKKRFAISLLLLLVITILAQATGT